MENLIRKVSIRMISVLALAVASLPTQATALVDSFLQISGITGESMDDRHANWIDIQSASLGLASAQQQTFRFVTRNVTLASPALVLAAASGQHSSNAVVAIRRAGVGQPDYLRYILTDVVVVSDSVGGSDGTAPGEQFTLSFTAIQTEYRQQRPDGSYGPPTITCWDFVLGAPCS
jgi:type VI secretion system secreted protein Hcp